MNINKIRTNLICASALSLALSGGALVGTESRIFLGIGAGDASVEATGYVDWDISGTVSDSGSDPAYGVGARLALGSFLVRAEYELYDFDSVDVEMISISGVYTF